MTTAPAMPDFAKTVNAVVIRSSVWLGIRRIINNFRSLKNNCKNLPKPVDTLNITAYGNCMTTNHDIKDLVNEDGTPTKLFMSLWREDKEAVKGNNLFLGKEGGKWVVKAGKPVFKACHNSSTIASGNCSTREAAQALLDRRLAMFAKEYSGEKMAELQAALNIRVEYDRPKFGTPEERAARRQSWMALAEAKREERKSADYRPSRWELNYTPSPEEDVE